LRLRLLRLVDRGSRVSRIPCVAFVVRERSPVDDPGASRPRGAATVARVKMHAGMRLSRHARNEMRLYCIALDDVESAAADPVARDVDDRGNTRLTGPAVDGRLILVVVARDDPDFVITVFLRS